MTRPSLLRLLVLLVLSAGFAPAADADDVIRVRILENAAPTAVVVSSSSGAVDIFAGDFDQPIATLKQGEKARVAQSSGQLSIVVEGVRLFADELRARSSSAMLVHVDEGGTTGTERLLPGELHITPGPGSRLVLSNVLDLEEYVASVISHEYGFDDLEGSKAMAVVARTYALKRVHDNAAPLSDDVGSQVYGDQRRVTDIAREATEATRGEVLTYDGALIEAVYSSSSGGHTASNEDVWASSPLPYLRSRMDPFDAESPHRTWTARVDREQLLRALSRELGFAVSGFIAGDRGPDGRVGTVELLRMSGPREEISANAFRLIVNRAFGVQSLKSTNFEARREGDEYVFSGTGFGHGVGLNQHGARYLASRGYSYRDILGYYYTGVALTTHRNGSPAGDAVVLAPDPQLLAEAGETVPAPAIALGPTEPPQASPRADQRDERVTSPRQTQTARPQPERAKQARRIGW